ncbi:MAG: type II toxin-antitoxin system PemK/MazF family toxin [Parachlamydiaceae bacterium]|nr:type II toxin-antitoxin system PemK/MazF family toxin [Parachlamydiaceae bacterium]
MADYPKRGEIYWIQLDPTIGTEIQKTRPCLILSNNSQNKKGIRVIAAPITSNVKNIYPFEAKIIIKGRECKVSLDQIRALDKQRIISKVDSIDSLEMYHVEEALKVALALKKD